MSDFVIIHPLTPGRSWLARDVSGREVVLKILDANCLMEDQLHPNVYDRLKNIRELPHAGVANLIGVFSGSSIFENGIPAVAAWEFISGENLESYAKKASANELENIARDIRLLVNHLHALGLVHGNLHGRNMIIDANGNVHLTDFSPLLHYELKVDLAALERMFPTTPIGEPIIATSNRKWRGGPIFGAIAVALIAIAVAGVIALLLNGKSSGTTPPRAPVEAMSP